MSNAENRSDYIDDLKFTFSRHKIGCSTTAFFILAFGIASIVKGLASLALLAGW